MAFMLDTNVLSRLRRIHRAPPHFRAWAESIDYDQVYLSVITMMEVESGIVGAARHDEAFAQILSNWREQVLSRLSARILPVDTNVALRTARLLAMRTIDTPDALIAATAYEHKLTLVTHNVRHFTGFGIDIIDPFTP